RKCASREIHDPDVVARPCADPECGALTVRRKSYELEFARLAERVVSCTALIHPREAPVQRARRIHEAAGLCQAGCRISGFGARHANGIEYLHGSSGDASTPDVEWYCHDATVGAHVHQLPVHYSERPRREDAERRYLASIVERSHRELCAIDGAVPDGEHDSPPVTEHVRILVTVLLAFRVDVRERRQCPTAGIHVIETSE